MLCPKKSEGGIDNAFVRAQQRLLSNHLFRGNLPPGEWEEGCEGYGEAILISAATTNKPTRPFWGHQH